MVTLANQKTLMNSLMPSRTLLWTFRALCAIALVISVYLAWTAFSMKQVYGCGGGEVFDCGHVLTSKYSKIFGLPVSVPAVGLYASLLALLAFFRPTAPQQLLKTGWSILTIGVFSAAFAAIWFIAIQVFVLKHLCTYCLVAHSCGLLLAAIMLWKRPLSMKVMSALACISVAGIAVLAAGQIFTEEPQTFTVERFDDPVTDIASTDGPVKFGAPVEFGPPVANSTNFFAPPTVEVPVTTDPEILRSGEIPVKAVDRPDEKDAAKTDDPAGNVTTSKDSVSQTSRSDSTPTEKIKATTAKAAYLFFSPGATRLATKFFSVPSDADDEQDATSTVEAATETKDETVTETVPAATPVQRLVTVDRDRFSLNTRHWPLLGNPDAKYVFVEMFDYTCAHCRNTHHAIDGAFDRFGSDLAVIVLPVPLEKNCNDAATGNGHPGACELARIAICVWRVDQSKFKQFHDWMFKEQRTTSQAKAEAERLIGREALAAEMGLPHASNYIKKHVELYKQVGSGAVPKLMFPKATMTGAISSTDFLCATILKEFGR